MKKESQPRYPWKALGNAMRELREWHDYTQEELIEKTGLRETARSWRRYETGERKLGRKELASLMDAGFEIKDLAKVNRLLALGHYAPLSPKEAAAVGIDDTPEAVALGNAAALLVPHVRVWWPEPGCRVSGEQPFKALVPELPLTEYTMYWQIEGDSRRHEMMSVRDPNPHADHKEARVLIPYLFPGAGPHRVQFVAEGLDGRELTREMVEFYHLEHQ
jgi:hypothetical protein